jgi:hypothetical protein
LPILATPGYRIFGTAGQFPASGASAPEAGKTAPAFFNVLSKKEITVDRGLRLGIFALSLAVLGAQAAAQPVFDFLKGLTVP